MMVRCLVACETCDCPVTLRIGLGHSRAQRHTFLCPECLEVMSVALDLDPENLGYAFRCVENCVEGESEGEVLNISPHFVITREMVNEDQSFGWMQQAAELFRLNESGGEKPPGARGVDVYDALGGMSNLPELWLHVRKAWRLSRNKRIGLAKSQLRKYTPPGYGGSLSFDDVLFDFSWRLLRPKWTDEFEKAKSAIERTQKAYPKEHDRFWRYYIKELRASNLARYVDIYTEYVRDFSEYDQVLLHVKSHAEIPSGCVATSSEFENTKMFYGNAFENYTSNLVVLACLNNVAEGRPFDLFRSMDLKRYLKTNKAGRGRAFESREELKPFLGSLDSSLRNASHHKSMSLVDHHRMIEYRSGGTSAKKEISYSSYLGKCNEIVLCSAMLLMIELWFTRQIGE